MSPTGPIAGVRISRDGITLPTTVDETVDIRFDGRRVFSASPSGDTPWKVAWPKRLVPYLEGSATIAVAAHVSGTVLAEEELRFSTAPGRVAVVDPQGRPLSVDQFGHLVRMFDSLGVDTAADIVATGDKIARDLGDFGVPAWVTGGALLGALRTGHMIGHDMDIDVTYVSNYTDPADFTLENYELERFLIGRGWHMTRIRVGLMRAQFTDLDGDERHIDIFVGHFRNGAFHSDRFIEAPFTRETLLPLDTVTLEGQDVLAPADPQALMEASYGPTWTIPDPSFSFTFTNERLRKSQAWYGVFPQFRNAWERILSGAWRSGRFGPASSFSTWVLTMSTQERPLVELGSGRGADSMAYARAGRRVVCSDYVRVALKRTVSAAKAEGLDLRSERFNFYDLRPCLRSTASLWAEFAGPAEVVSRDTLDVLESEGRLTFWTVTRGLCRGGGSAFVEFRTAPRKRANANPAFRPLDPEVEVRAAQERGGTIIERRDHNGRTRLMIEFP